MSVSRMRINCPHCGSPAKIRTSKEMSLISREVYFQCTNDPADCGHAWKSLLSAVVTTAPSRSPNPNVYIPLSEKTLPSANVTARANAG